MVASAIAGSSKFGKNEPQQHNNKQTGNTEHGKNTTTISATLDIMGILQYYSRRAESDTENGRMEGEHSLCRRRVLEGLLSLPLRLGRQKL